MEPVLTRLFFLSLSSVRCQARATGSPSAQALSRATVDCWRCCVPLLALSCENDLPAFARRRLSPSFPSLLPGLIPLLSPHRQLHRSLLLLLTLPSSPLAIPRRLQPSPHLPLPLSSHLSISPTHLTDDLQHLPTTSMTTTYPLLALRKRGVQTWARGVGAEGNEEEEKGARLSW